MPRHWDERADVLGGRADDERARELRYISRWRSEPEIEEVLAREDFFDRRRHPDREARPAPPRVRRPAGAPSGKIDISQLYYEGVYDEIRGLIRQISGGLKSAELEMSLRGDVGGEVPKVKGRVFVAELAQPEWARACVWGTSNPRHCVPLQPFGEEDPPEQQVNGDFFRAWASRLGWRDGDMLQQVMTTGSDSRSDCSRDTVISGHHAGLRRAFAPAHRSVMSDVAAGWVAPGRGDLWTVPARLARAVAVVKARAGEMGITLEEWGRERVALWALDLTNAYRMMASARHERWLQQFIWFDGVCLDERCEFGTAHMVDLFERVTTFVLEVAKRRIREYDEKHPFGPVRSKWQRWRREQGLSDECSFADIYLDDGFGMTCVGADEDCRARPGEAARVSALVTVGSQGRVRLRFAVGVARPEMHLAI